MVRKSVKGERRLPTQVLHDDGRRVTARRGLVQPLGVADLGQGTVGHGFVLLKVVAKGGQQGLAHGGGIGRSLHAPNLVVAGKTRPWSSSEVSVQS